MWRWREEIGISLLLIVMAVLLYCKLYTVLVKEMKHIKKG